jgi:hypothetical protein
MTKPENLQPQGTILQASQYRVLRKNTLPQTDITQPAQITQVPSATQHPTTISVSSGSGATNTPKPAEAPPKSDPVDPRKEDQLK